MRVQYISILLAVLVSVSLGNSATATVIFNNGLPDTTPPVSGMDIVNGVVAEDFSLNRNAWLTDVHFWTFEEPNRPTAWDGTANWFLFADAGGQPSSASFASGAGVNIQKMFLGIVQTGSQFLVDQEHYEYWLDLDVPVALLANTPYWIGLTLGNASNFAASWMTTSNGAPFGNGSYISVNNFASWTTNDRHLAFNLTTVPEPAGLALFGLGFVGLALYRRRKQ